MQLNQYILFCLIVISSISFAIGSNINILRIKDTGKPITIDMVINKEVELEFDQTVDIGIPEVISAKLQVQIIDKRAYIKALEPLDTNKLIVKYANGKVGILLVQTVSDSQFYNFAIVSLKKETQQEPKLANKDIAKQYNYVDYMRFVAQKLYAPERLIKDISMYRVPLRKHTDELGLFTCAISTICVDVQTKVLASWSNGSYFVTAVELINKTSNIIDLDPIVIKGSWLAAAFYSNQLYARDKTVLFLLSNSAFGQAL